MRNIKKLLCVVFTGIVQSSCAAAPHGTEEYLKAGSKETVASVQSTAGEEDEMQMTLKIGENTFTVQLEDNETADAFTGMLPMTITMAELNGNEKYFYLDEALPASSTVPDRIEAGDVMLFGDSCLVVFYESFSTSYSYTPIGHITDTEQLKDAIGSGSVSMEWKFE